MTQHDDLVYLGDMLDAARKARDIARPLNKQHFDADETMQLALARLVQIIGEAARHVTHDRRASLPDIPWHRVIGMRHRLVHDYGNIDMGIVWQTVTTDLPPLIEALASVVPPEPPE